MKRAAEESTELTPASTEAGTLKSKQPRLKGSWAAVFAKKPSGEDKTGGGQGEWRTHDSSVLLLEHGFRDAVSATTGPIKLACFDLVCIFR